MTTYTRVKGGMEKEALPSASCLHHTVNHIQRVKMGEKGRERERKREKGREREREREKGRERERNEIKEARGKTWKT